MMHILYHPHHDVIEVSNYPARLLQGLEQNFTMGSCWVVAWFAFLLPYIIHFMLLSVVMQANVWDHHTSSNWFKGYRKGNVRYFEAAISFVKYIWPLRCSAVLIQIWGCLTYFLLWSIGQSSVDIYVWKFVWIENTSPIQGSFVWKMRTCDRCNG